MAPPRKSSVEARAWVAAHPVVGHNISGQFVEPAGQTVEVLNPAADEILTRMVLGTEAEVDAAVHAAQTAFPKWSASLGHARAKYLYAIARHVLKHERFLSVLETLDNGKTIRETHDIDIPLVARHFYQHAGWYAAQADKFDGAVTATKTRHVTMPVNEPLWDHRHSGT